MHTLKRDRNYTLGLVWGISALHAFFIITGAPQTEFSKIFYHIFVIQKTDCGEKLEIK